MLQLTLAAILVAINGMAEPSRRWKPYWFVLAGMFVFLSFDENVGVHEYVVMASDPRRLLVVLLDHSLWRH